MELTGELVAAARKGRASAAEEILAAHYPTVWRIATGLTGRADVGRGVTRHIMQRSLRAMHKWTDEAAATRWFHHHTVLTTRRASKHEPGIADDTFTRNHQNDPAYLATVRALRSLPMQQREAFILSDLEGMGARAVAVAMDCSMVAAETHLSEAKKRLQELAGVQYGSHIVKMSEAYRMLLPDEAMIVQHARASIYRIMIPWRILRKAKVTLSILALIATAWFAVWLWRIVQHSIQ